MDSLLSVTWKQVFLVLFVVGALTLVLHDYLFKKKTPPKGRLMPGPPSYPIIGVAHELVMNRNCLIEYLEGNVAKYGTHVQFPTAHVDIIAVVAEPESAEYILKTNFDNYPKGEVFRDILQDLLGFGIFNADGDQWRDQRKTFSHLFKTNTLKTLMYDTFVKHGHIVVELLQGYADRKEELDIIQLFYKFTFDSIGEIAFGKNLGSLHKETAVSRAFDTALNCLEKRVAWPLWKITPDAKLKQSSKILDHFAYQLIKERRNDPDVAKKTDVLSLYIRNTTENDTYLRDVIMNFLIAGRDTTGQTLSWFFYLLAQNPQVEKKLLQEIQTLGGKLPDYDQLKKLPYLEACIKETLRLYPPVPFDPKRALEDDVLPNGFYVQKGTHLFWSAWVMGRLEKYWENPLEMKPERWLDEEKVNKMHPYLFIPFQAGPRICLGMKMAYIEIKVLVTMILQAGLVARMVPGFKARPVFNITLTSSNGVVLRMEKANL